MTTKGVSPLQQKLAWIFLGKRLLRSDSYTLRCSRCNAKMKKVTKEKVTIDVCPFCGGMHLDNGEINKLVQLNKKKEPQRGTRKT